MHAFIDPFLLMNWGFDQRLPDPVSLKMNCSFNCGVKINPSLLNPSFITAFVKVFYFSNRKKMKTMSLNFCSSCPFIPSARIPGVYHHAQLYAEPKILCKPVRLTIKCTTSLAQTFDLIVHLLWETILAHENRVHMVVQEMTRCWEFKSTRNGWTLSCYCRGCK